MKDREGSILIFVLWVMIILSILSAAISYRASGDIRLARYEYKNLKARCLARAAIIEISDDLNKDQNNFDSIDEDWNREKELSLDGDRVTYRIYDESARPNLNSQNLDMEQLMGLGIDRDLCLQIMDYKHKKGEKGFEFMEELFLINGMTRDIYKGIKDYITIYRGPDQRININTAGEKVLIAALRDGLLVNKIIEFRERPDVRNSGSWRGVFTEDNFSIVFEDFGITPDNILIYQPLFRMKSDYFRAVIDVFFSEEDKKTRHFLAVLDRSGKIYYWKEE